MSKVKEENRPNPKIGKRLKELILSKGLSQSKIARDLHYSNNTISNIVNGYNYLSPDMASNLSEYLGVSKEYLLCESDYPNGHWKNLAKDISEMNINTGYYHQCFTSDIIIMYDDDIEAFRLSNKKTKEIRYATKDQLDDYCKYVLKQKTSVQKLFWDLLENQIVDGHKTPHNMPRIETKVEHYRDPETGEPYTKKFYKDDKGKWKVGGADDLT